MPSFLDVLFRDPARVFDEPQHTVDGLAIEMTEQFRELQKLRTMIAALCTALVERGLVDQGELLQLMREGLMRVDPMMVPPTFDDEPNKEAAPPPSADPYRDGSVRLDAGEGPLVTCVRCGRLVAQKQTNLASDGAVCDRCWEPQI